MNKLSNEAKLEINQVLAPFGLKITASVTSEGFNLYENTGNSSKVINRDKCFEEAIDHKAIDQCTRCQLLSIFNNYMKGGLNMTEPTLFTEIKEVLPLLISTDRITRMVGEYWELDIRITKLRKYFTSHISSDLSQHAQLESMITYQNYLAKRLSKEGVCVYASEWKKLANKAIGNPVQQRVQPLQIQPKVEVHAVQVNIPAVNHAAIEKVIANEAGKTVIVFFKDGGKEVVHCSKEDTFDVYVGVSVAISRHLNGTTSKFRRFVDKITIVPKAKKAKESVKEEAPVTAAKAAPKKKTTRGTK